MSSQPKGDLNDSLLEVLALLSREAPRKMVEAESNPVPAHPFGKPVLECAAPLHGLPRQIPVAPELDEGWIADYELRHQWPDIGEEDER